MKLWKLNFTSEGYKKFVADAPWGKVDEVIIRAETETGARMFAAQQACDNLHGPDHPAEVWLDAKYTDCEAVPVDGEVEIIAMSRINA